MSLLDTIFRKAVPDRRPSDQPASPIGTWGGEKRTVVTYQETIAAEMALRHPVVSRCLRKIAASAASVQWYAEADTSLPVNERAGARAVKAVNDLLQSPNDYYTRSQLIYWMALNYAAYGRVPFKVGVNPLEPHLPTGIYPLTTRFFKTRRDDRGLVSGYIYGNGTENEEVLPIRRKSNGKAYAHEIVRPNLDGTFESQNNVTPLASIGLPAQVTVLLLQRAADTASGHPNTKYIVTCEKTLTDKQKKAIKEQIDAREVEGEQSGQVLFLYNTAIKVDKLDNDLSDIHSKMPLDDMARQIVGAFGIPIALIGLGAADGAKFASNYNESRRSFWEDTMIPEYLEPFATGMTVAVAPAGMKIRFDYDSIEAISEARVAKAERLSKVTFLTKNDKREMTGRDRHW